MIGDNHYVWNGKDLGKGLRYAEQRHQNPGQYKDGGEDLIVHEAVRGITQSYYLSTPQQIIDLLVQGEDLDVITRLVARRD